MHSSLYFDAFIFDSKSVFKLPLVVSVIAKVFNFFTSAAFFLIDESIFLNFDSTSFSFSFEDDVLLEEDSVGLLLLLLLPEKRNTFRSFLSFPSPLSNVRSQLAFSLLLFQLFSFFFFPFCLGFDPDFFLRIERFPFDCFLNRRFSSSVRVSAPSRRRRSSSSSSPSSSKSSSLFSKTTSFCFWLRRGSLLFSTT